MRLRLIVAVVALLTAGSFAVADIVNATCADDGDGAVTMGPWSWSWDAVEQTATMEISEVMNWAPAHIYTSFVSDTQTDPSAWVLKEVQNNTTFDWTDYHLNIYMDKPYTIAAGVGPADWLAPVITQPVFDGIAYHGAVDFFYDGAGTEIAIGELGDFGAKMTFEGTADFCIEQIPTPEPASLALMGMGAVALLRRRR